MNEVQAIITKHKPEDPKKVIAKHAPPSSPTNQLKEIMNRVASVQPGNGTVTPDIQKEALKIIAETFQTET